MSEALKAPPAAEPGQTDRGPDGQRSFRVVVVEDDAVLRMLYRKCIESWEFPVELRDFACGQEALNSIERDPPDLLICDLRVGGIEGGQLTHRIRALPQGAPIEIAVVSGYDAEACKRRGDLPADIHCFAKPAPMDDLSRLATRVRGRVAMRDSGAAGSN